MSLTCHREAFAGFAINAHANGAHNPYAMFRRAIKPETYQKAGMVSAPLNMFDVAPNADGAAAVVLVNPDRLPAVYPNPLVRVAGSSVATDTLALHDRPDPLTLYAAHQSVIRACEQAGLGVEEMDLFELHDAYSIYSALSLEAGGIFSVGSGLAAGAKWRNHTGGPAAHHHIWRGESAR